MGGSHEPVYLCVTLGFLCMIYQLSDFVLIENLVSKYSTMACAPHSKKNKLSGVTPSIATLWASQ